MRLDLLFTSLWNILNYQFVFNGGYITLWNVIEAGIVLSIMGLAIGKLILFINNRR